MLESLLMLLKSGLLSEKGVLKSRYVVLKSGLIG